MPEDTPIIMEENKSSQPINKDGANGSNSNEEGKGTNQDFAAKRLAEKAEKLQSELEAKDARIKELERQSLPEDKQVDAEFLDLTTEKILRGIDKEKFSKLPKTIQNSIEKNPFRFVDETEMEVEMSKGKTKREQYKIAEKLALDSINNMFEDEGGEDNSNQNKEVKDPSISKTGSPEGATGTSVGELMLKAYTDPEGYSKMQRSIKR